MNLYENKVDFSDAILAASTYLNISEAIIEKDYYVTLFLHRIIQSDQGLVFKGGTSLSKCYKLIDRYSEDIDLSYMNVEPTTGKKKKIKQSIVNAASEYAMIITNQEDTRSRRTFNRYCIDYHSQYSSQSIKHGIIVETAFQTPAFPVVMKSASSLLADYLGLNHMDGFIEEYEMEPFLVPAQSLERTMIDKLFALCDYYIDNKAYEHSRHLYDVNKLFSNVELNQEFMDLLIQVRQWRSRLAICPSAKENVVISKMLLEIVTTDFYRQDYQSNTDPLCWKLVDYKESKNTLEKIATVLEEYGL